MLYRKAPPSPPRLLLRIVATAGTSALVGAVACSSTSSGSIAIMPSDDASDASNAVMGFGAYPCYEDASACGDAAGLITNPDDGGPCNGGPCGAVIMPGDDAGDAGEPPMDASSDGESLDAVDEGTVHCGVCGVIVHIDP
ncbi:MAG TPA: hypothetical protein VK762_12035 [Polyangiaceae bacterium]|jgi:hypothetical protein|nr:hypothetical protein [Polyangiaceae bacterium]